MAVDAHVPESRTGDDASKVRGYPILSLVLFVHLFCIAITLTSAHFPSVLQNRLMQLFAPYLQPTNFDVSFKPFYLTLGSVDDQDHRIAVLPAGQDANDAQAWVELPPAGGAGGERLHRYQRLASTLAFFAERQQDNQSALISRSVGEHFLNARKVEPVQVRCQRILPQDRSAVEGGTMAERDPLDSQYLTEVYRANAIVDGKIVSVIKVEDAGQVARPDSKEGQP